MRKHNVNDIDLKIHEVQVSEGFILFRWSSNRGFGEYALFQNSKTGEWVADTEYMDSDDDKNFGKKLFELLMDKVKIRE